MRKIPHILLHLRTFHRMMQNGVFHFVNLFCILWVDLTNAALYT